LSDEITEGFGHGAHSLIRITTTNVAALAPFEEKIECIAAVGTADYTE
jgi:hypothetical protein